MLVNERPLFVRVAVVANLVPSRVRPQLCRTESPMRVMAIVACHQAFVHTVVKGPRKLRPHIHVARVAEFGRFHFQQVLPFLGVVWRMALDARHAVRQVRRAIVVALLLVVLVAS